MSKKTSSYVIKLRSVCTFVDVKDKRGRGGDKNGFLRNK